MNLPPLRIDFDLEISADGPLFRDPDNAALMRAFQAGVRQGGEFLRGLWVRVAQEMDIRATGAYIRGIRDSGIVNLIENNLSPSAPQWEITLEVTNTAEHASYIEDGHAAFSLVDLINWGGGGRIKWSDKGTPYLHIPFRHSAYQDAGQRQQSGMTTATLKTMMPEHIYRQAQALTRTARLGVGPIYNKKGQFVAADRYRWGTRLHRNTTPAIILGGPGAPNAGGRGEVGFEEHRGARLVGKANGKPLVNPAWQNSKFAGMFKAGAEHHSQYMTIRTITPTSKGWNIPAMAGLGVSRRVLSVAQSSGHLEEIITAGMVAALERA